ncbi:MAG: hypothetical protein KF836_12745 [Fimbriimonadaceae bacterium]|nr:hypothetical protein [Fimbriimonadaceae bacterium]
MRIITTALLVGLMGSAVVVAPSIAEAQVSKKGTKYQLRMKWTKNLKMSYDIDIQAPGQSQSMKMGLTYLVKSVKGTTGSVLVTMSGMGEKPSSSTVSIDERGRVSGGDSQSMGNFLEYPVNPIGVGESWSTKGSLPGMTGGTMDGTAKHTLKGFKTISGKQYAHIASTITTSSGNDLKGSGSSDSLVSMADGHTLRSTMNMKMTFTMPAQNGGKPQSQTINMVVKMTKK